MKAEEVGEKLRRHGFYFSRRLVHVAVCAFQDFEFSQSPKDIDGWIAWLEAARSEIPEEYRQVARCVLTHERGCWDEGCSSDFSVYYWRKETDEEFNARQAEALAAIERDELAERERYEELKRRFEGGTSETK